MKKSETSVRSLLEAFAWPRRGRFALGVGLLLAAVFLQRIPALVVGVALDALLLEHQAYALPVVPDAWLPASTAGQAAFTVGALGAAVVGESAAQWYGSLVYEEASLETLHDVRVSVFDAAAALPMAVHDDRDRGDVLGVVNDDVDNFGDLFAGARDGLLYAGGLVSAFAFMVALNWQLAAVLLVVPAALVVTARVYARLLEPRYDGVRESVGAVNVAVRDAVQGLPTVKAFTGERTERERVADASAGFRDSKWAALRLRIAYDAASWFFGTAGIWGLFLLGGYWILEGPPAGFTAQFSAGSLLTFLVYAESFLDPTRRLAVDVVDKVESARASARRIAGLLDREDRVEAGDSDLDVTDGRVEYEDVTFGYDSDGDGATIDGVSLAAAPGEFVGVVGSTGAGKSTLLQLLLRFYDPDSGAVRVDGQRVADAPPEAVREHVGYVGQDPFLFPGTVAENVALGEDDPDREAVVEAAKAAGAHEFVTDLPEGYDTDVGERGASLSGGQRQRLALARALHGDPEILVLDEATSHVDNETEAAIQRRLAGMAGERTVFAIAHRLSTVRDADRILVLEDGEVAERGTHDELVDAGGAYASLWRVQTGAVAAEAVDSDGVASESVVDDAIAAEADDGDEDGTTSRASERSARPEVEK